jgi:hypothetical protein
MISLQHETRLHREIFSLTSKKSIKHFFKELGLVGFAEPVLVVLKLCVALLQPYKLTSFLLGQDPRIFFLDAILFSSCD